MSFGINDVIGGVSTPRVYKLEDNNRVTNGSIETALSTEWFGAGYTRVLASAQSPSFTAPKGDYVMKVDDDDGSAWEAAKQSIDYGSALGNKTFILVGRVRGSTTHNVDIKFGSATAADGAINNAAVLTVSASNERFRVFHIVKTFSSETDQYIRLELGSSIATASATGVAFYDDIRVYEVEDTYNFTQPNKWKQNWAEEKITDFDLIDGKNRKVLNGWRYFLDMIYEYNETSQQQEVVRITENGLNFVVPHIDNLFGWFMRWNGDFDNQYAFDRFDGHSVVVALKAVELLNEKPLESGSDYSLA